MLRNVARGTRLRRDIEHQSRQLQLPWLCPALFRWSSSGESKLPHTIPRVTSRIGPRPTNARHLASAATASQETEDSHIPFDFSSATWEPSPSNTYLSFNKPLSAAVHVTLDHHEGQYENRRLLRRWRLGSAEIGGDQSEIQATFDACLQVGQFSRARSLAHRLAEFHPPNSPKTVAIFNRYLRGIVADLGVEQRARNMELINGCIEVDMKKAGVQADAMTYALMIKAALNGLQGSKRDRTARRYWNIVKDLELESEVASLQNILTDYDLGMISEICPIELGDTNEARDDLTKARGGGESEETQDTNFSQQLPTAQSKIYYLKETDQKGGGMTALRQSLSMFSEPLQLDRDKLATTEDIPKPHDEQDLIARQTRLEKDALDSAIERWRKDHEMLKKAHRESDRELVSLKSQLFQWQQKLARRLQEELDLCKEADLKANSKQGLLTTAEKDRQEYGPFLRLVKPDQLAALTILTVFQRFSRHGSSEPMRLSNMVMYVSKAVESEAVAEALANSLKQSFGQRAKKTLITRSINRLLNMGLLSKDRVNPDKIARIWQQCNRSYSAAELQPWPSTIHAKVGAVLCSHLFEAAKVTVYKEDSKTGKQLSNIQPVFQQRNKFEKGKRRTFVAVHPALVEKLAQEPPTNLISKQVPMLAKPRPWKSFEEGGYLTTSAGFLRIKHGELLQRKYAEAAIERGDLEGYFAGLNILGETGWKINLEVFLIMQEAWNSGQRIANFAPENPQVEMPPRPVEPDAVKYRIWSHEVTRLENTRAGLHSERCFQNFQLEIAKAFLHETFYLPHNIDFRGRAYPIPPYFHQMSADHCRGLLLFAEGRELGEHGLRWLKIHLANVYGYDKASLSEREAFADMHLDDIKDSTENPLKGKQWWLKAEDPWQCLATSFELRKALESPDPTRYVSHMPVHQDGSCNGLQHYAALGGDVEGAQQVNLEPGDRPSDVYTGVAELVKAEVEEDLKKGIKEAKLLTGKITRKIVKQTVMTNVYGVTFIGAMRQVRRRLEELHPELEQKSIILSAYTARKIFRALGTLFSGAHDIQFWLGDCANRINSSLTPDQLDHLSKKYGFIQLDLDRGESKTLSAKEAAALRKIAFRCSVTWTTPLKLPVVQPYRDVKPKRILTRLQNLSISAPTLLDNVNKRKQLQAFPPNFIHSLDATHMMLSAIKCKELGLTFSAVHDSFWTHAADVDRMNEALRTEFIRMHSEDVIGRLAAEFEARYNKNLYEASIPIHTELGRKISKWKSDYSATFGLKQQKSEFKLVEVLTEHKRQKLLRSDDPQERKAGEAMVTPASIFEAEGRGDSSLAIRNSLGQTAIGHVPEVTSEQTLKTALAEGGDSAENVDLVHSILPGAGDQVEPLNDDLLRDLKQTLDNVAGSATSEMKTREVEKERQRQKRAAKTISLWLPLRIPDVPRRGDWDVSRLRNSAYFFS